MGKVETLASAYEQQIGAPWQRTISGAQRVIMLVYEKELERTLRSRIELFKQATLRQHHEWELIDCTAWFAEWMRSDDYAEAYFADPSLLPMKLHGEFKPHVAQRLRDRLKHADENTVLALQGVASLYGFLRVSELIHEVEQAIFGRLLVFFPGTKDGNNYRLLDARDGWNYLANGITLHSRSTAL